MRRWCLRRDDLRSATLISLLAYAGPRPESEALPLRWAAIRRRTILFRATKRGAPSERATRLLAPLADDLRTWRETCGHPPRRRARHPQPPRRPLGRPRLGQLAQPHVPRGRRGRRPARRQADGARRVRPRDLRSSFATLLIYEGQPPQYVAEQLGHSAATLLRDYARVWEDFDPSQRVSAEEQIQRVRAGDTAPSGPDAERGAAGAAARRLAGGRVPQVFRDRRCSRCRENETLD